MKNASMLFAASIVAGALAAPVVIAQTSTGSTGATGSSGGTASTRSQGNQTSPTDGRSGGAGVPSSTSGATPSTQPGADQASGRTGDVVRDRNMSGDTTRDRTTDTTRDTMRDNRATPRQSEKSPTDGRAGGAGYPSSASGATPSTNPTEGSGTRRN